MIASTSSRASACAISAGSSRCTARDSALRASGRFRVIVATRSATSSSTTSSSAMRRSYGRSVRGVVVGGVVFELEVAETHQRRRDPAAERTEVFVEDCARTVGERLLGQLVQTLVGDLDRVVRQRVGVGVVGPLLVADLDGGA